MGYDDCAAFDASRWAIAHGRKLPQLAAAHRLDHATNAGSLPSRAQHALGSAVLASVNQVVSVHAQYSHGRSGGDTETRGNTR